MEVAKAQIQHAGKGDDAILVRSLGDGGPVLLAVADGLTQNNGRAAAQWVVEHLADLALPDMSTRAILAELLHRLHDRVGEGAQSETTLTCGLLRSVCRDDGTFLRFDFFAVGDSPIWKVVEGDAKFPYQRVLVHGGVYPAETAKVYSRIRLEERDLKGSVTFGAIEVDPGEVLVVCTDGIPEREVFVRDVTRADEGPSGGLCAWLLHTRSFDDLGLQRTLEQYAQRGVLSDDATIIAARLGSGLADLPPASARRSVVALPDTSLPDRDGRLGAVAEAREDQLSAAGASPSDDRPQQMASSPTELEPTGPKPLSSDAGLLSAAFGSEPKGFDPGGSSGNDPRQAPAEESQMGSEVATRTLESAETGTTTVDEAPNARGAKSVGASRGRDAQNASATVAICRPTRKSVKYSNQRKK